MKKILTLLKLFFLLIISVSSHRLKNISSVNNNGESNAVTAEFAYLFYDHSCQNVLEVKTNQAFVFFSRPVDPEEAVAFPSNIEVYVFLEGDDTTPVGDSINCTTESDLSDKKYFAYNCKVGLTYLQTPGIYYLKKNATTKGTNLYVGTFDGKGTLFGVVATEVNELTSTTTTRELLISKTYPIDTLFFIFQKPLTAIPESAYIKSTNMTCVIDTSDRTKLKCNTGRLSIDPDVRTIGFFSTECPNVESMFFVIYKNTNVTDIIEFSQTSEKLRKCGTLLNESTPITIELDYEVQSGEITTFQIENKCLHLKSQNEDLKINCSNVPSFGERNLYQITCIFKNPENNGNYRLAIEENCFPTDSDSFVLRPFEINNFVGKTDYYVVPLTQEVKLEVDYLQGKTKSISISFADKLNPEAYVPYVILTDNTQNIELQCFVVAGNTSITCNFDNEKLPPDAADRYTYKDYTGYMINICGQPQVPVTISVKDTTKLPTVAITGARFPHYCNQYNGILETTVYLTYSRAGYQGEMKEFKINLLHEDTVSKANCTCNNHVGELGLEEFECICIPKVGNKRGIYHPHLAKDYYLYTYLIGAFDFPLVTAELTTKVNAYVLSLQINATTNTIITSGKYDELSTLGGDLTYFPIVFDRKLDPKNLPRVEFDKEGEVTCYNDENNETLRQVMLCFINSGTFPVRDYVYTAQYYDICEQPVHKLELTVGEIAHIHLTDFSYYEEPTTCASLPRGSTFYFNNDQYLKFTTLGSITEDDNFFLEYKSLLGTVYRINLTCTIISLYFACKTASDPLADGEYTFRLTKDLDFGNDVHLNISNMQVTTTININENAMRYVNDFIGGSYNYDYKNGLLGRFSLKFHKEIPSSVHYKPVITATSYETNVSKTLDCRLDKKFIQCFFGVNVISPKAVYGFKISSNNICGEDSTFIFKLSVKNTGPPIVVLNDKVDFGDFRNGANVKSDSEFFIDFESDEQFSVSETISGVVLKSSNKRNEFQIPLLCNIKGNQLACKMNGQTTSDQYINGKYKVKLKDDLKIRDKAIIFRYTSDDEIDINSRFSLPNYDGIQPSFEANYSSNPVGHFNIPFKSKVNPHTVIYTGVVDLPCTPTGNTMDCYFTEGTFLPGSSNTVRVRNACGKLLDDTAVTIKVADSTSSSQKGLAVLSTEFPETCWKFDDSFSFSINVDDHDRLSSSSVFTKSYLVSDQSHTIKTSCKFSGSSYKEQIKCNIEAGQKLEYEGYYNAFLEQQKFDRYVIPKYTSNQHIYFSKKDHVSLLVGPEVDFFHNYTKGTIGSFEIKTKTTCKNPPTIHFGKKSVSCSCKKSAIKCTFNENDFPANFTESNTTYQGELVNVCGMNELNITLNVATGPLSNKISAGVIVGTVIVVLVIAGVFALGCIKCRRENYKNPFKQIDIGVIQDVSSNDNYFLN